MSGLVNIKKCLEESAQQKIVDTETLTALLSSDEIGVHIEKNVQMIVRNKQAIAETKASKTPNAKLAEKFNANINICIDSIKTYLAKLGATPAEINKVVEDVNACNYQLVTLEVLRLMARKNPGINQRKYDQALKIIAIKNKNMAQKVY